MNIFILISCAICFNLVLAQTIDPIELRCLVCGIAVEHIEKEISKVDPMKKIPIGSFRIDHKGDKPANEVELRRSDVFLTELMETVCDNLDNYARAHIKTNGRLVVFPLITESGGMHPLMGKVDIIQDGDLNKSLKFYCEGILEDHEDVFMQGFKEGNNDAKYLCSHISEMCVATLEEKKLLEAEAEKFEPEQKEDLRAERITEHEEL